MPIDYTKYPPNWKSELRPAVLKRANNCCEFCGVADKSIQWRGRKKVREGQRMKFRTFGYESKEAALADGCRFNGRIDNGNHKEIGVYQTKVVLTIAHLDHDESNWDVRIDRLAALCQLCHLQYDAKEKYRRLVAKTNDRKVATRKHTIKGGIHPQAKLSDAQRDEIKQLRQQGMEYRELGKLYGVSGATIHEICKGKSYAYRKNQSTLNL